MSLLTRIVLLALGAAAGAYVILTYWVGVLLAPFSLSSSNQTVAGKSIIVVCLAALFLILIIAAVALHAYGSAWTHRLVGGIAAAVFMASIPFAMISGHVLLFKDVDGLLGMIR